MNKISHVYFVKKTFRCTGYITLLNIVDKLFLLIASKCLDVPNVYRIPSKYDRYSKVGKRLTVICLRQFEFDLACKMFF